MQQTVPLKAKRPLTPDKFRFWLTVLVALVACLVLAWLIGAPSGWTTADVLRDAVLLRAR